MLPGETFAYVLHMRPGQWLAIAVQVALGAALAVLIGRLHETGATLRLVLGTTVWTVAGFGGTLALNSAFDRDVGDVGGMHLPPPPPRHLAGYGLVVMLIGQAALSAVDARAAMLYAVCILLSVAYSVPPIRLKRVPGVDLAVNVLGFGVLSPLAGWMLLRAPLTRAGLASIAGIGLMMAALYPLTQIYQIDEDRERGDHTFAQRLGIRASLRVAFVTACAATVMLTGSLFAAAGPTAAGVAVAALAPWITFITRWMRSATALTSAGHGRSLYRVGNAYILAEIAIIVLCLARR